MTLAEELAKKHDYVNGYQYFEAAINEAIERCAEQVFMAEADSVPIFARSPLHYLNDAARRIRALKGKA